MCRIITLIVLFLAPTVIVAEEGEETEPEVRIHSPVADTERQTVTTGYVFLDGVYLPPPYEVGATADGITMNGKLVTAEPISWDDPWQGDSERRWEGAGKWGSRRRWPPRSDDGSATVEERSRPRNWSYQQARIARQLEEDAAFIAFAGRRTIVLEMPGHAGELLRVFLSPDRPSAVEEFVLASIPPTEQESIAAWLNSFRPPDQLLGRARKVTQQLDAVEAANHAQIDAVHRLDNFSYPATMLGMVLAVLASGHLLTSMPPRDGVSGEQPSTLKRATAISVGLIFCLSGLDLSWTILAAQAGQLRELNPIGNRLIEDPMWLIVFKTSITVLSCVVLLSLRGHHIARLASWWLCLVLTILTFRWLTFHSMFLGS